MNLNIELLQNIKLSGYKFDCGEDSLNHYILKQAKQDMKRHISATYILRNNSSLLGYYTLSSTIIPLDKLQNTDESFARKLPKYPYLPATLIGRLAVNIKDKKNGYGKILLIDALKRSCANSKIVGSIAILVDVINENASNFYQKYGFRELKKDQLFMAMNTIEKLFD